ncbi:MAG TPA: immunoglobulin domain-containing protein [Verrucomicrobiae bacterium]|nr:immunoglobulin domain-containing protein [Verrucomicrobiae bacterium]
MAITTTWRLGTRRTEADTIFNNSLPWNSYRGDLRLSETLQTLNDFQRVAIHEFGHTLGLGHPDTAGQNVVAIMNSHASDLDTLATDDVDGVTALYPGLPPWIATQPQSQTVTAGNAVVFSVVAYGDPAPAYQWYLNGNPIQNANDSSFGIQNVQPSSGGSYTVRVFNSYGSTLSQAAVLRVIVPPSITSQPQGKTVAAGASITFSVVASGTGPLSYQWYKDGFPVINAVSAVYTVAKAQPSDTGVYKVTVSNLAGDVDSAIAMLTVQYSPVISSQPSSQTLIVDETATFMVVAEGSPPPSYQWNFNGHAIAGANQSSLTIVGVSTNSTGYYNVSITNTLGKTNSTVVSLTVLDPFPGIYNTGMNDSRGLLPDGQVDPHYKLTANPDNAASSDAVVEDSSLPPIATGDWIQNSAKSKWIGPSVDTIAAPAGNYSYVLTLNLTGYNPATAILAGSWGTDDGGLILLNGVDMGFHSAGFSAFSTFSLNNGFVPGTNFVEFRVNNAASYTGLRVENLRGTAQKGVSPPSITAGPKSQSVIVGDNVTFAVTATGAGPLNYRWWWITGTNNPTTDATWTNSTLTLVNAQASNAGKFYAVVNNSGGVTLTAMATLTVSPPLAGVTIDSVTLNGGKFSLSFSTQTGHSYTVQSSPTLNPASWLTFTNITGNGSPVQVTDSGFTNSSRYYRVAAH